MPEFDAEDVCNLLHAKDPKCNLYIAVIHGYQAGSDIFFYGSPDLDGILKKIGSLFAAELEYTETLEYFLRETDKDYFEVYLKVDSRSMLKRAVQVFSYDSVPFNATDVLEPALNTALNRLLEADDDEEE